MNNQYLLLTGALRVFDNFSYSNCSRQFIYEFDNSNYKLLKSKYPVEAVAGEGDELSKVKNLLRWCCDNVLHNGGTKDVEFVPKTSIDILDYAYQKGVENGVYCRMQSIVFTECCLALGIKSRILHCVPFSPNDFDTHVVSVVYINDLNKWIMVDAGINGYFLDENENLLSPFEVRQKLAYNEFLRCNSDISPNSQQKLEDRQNNYKYYMSKNLFYFKSPRINTFGSDLLHGQETLYCYPVGFNVYERELSYCQFAVDNSPESFRSDWEKELIKIKNRKEEYISLSQEQFL